MDEDERPRLESGDRSESNGGLSRSARGDDDPFRRVFERVHRSPLVVPELYIEPIRSVSTRVDRPIFRNEIEPR